MSGGESIDTFEILKPRSRIKRIMGNSYKHKYYPTREITSTSIWDIMKVI